MSTSPLSLYNENAKKYGITEEMQVPNVAKLGFVRSQVQEQQSIINRLLVDVSITQTHLDNAKDEQTQEAYSKKVGEYGGDLRQLVSALKINLELLKELEDVVDKEA